MRPALKWLAKQCIMPRKKEVVYITTKGLKGQGLRFLSQVLGLRPLTIISTKRYRVLVVRRADLAKACRRARRYVGRKKWDAYISKLQHKVRGAY